MLQVLAVHIGVSHLPERTGFRDEMVRLRVPICLKYREGGEMRLTHRHMHVTMHDTANASSADSV